MTISASEKESCRRIRLKLDRLKAQDVEFAVFGAEYHRYCLEPPLPPQALADLEAQAGLTLPNAFHAFVTLVGNGGAGPYCGVKPVSTKTLTSPYMRNPCRITPEMSEAEWKELTASWYLGWLSPAEENAADETIFGGILHVCETGCAGWEGLVVEGPHSGRIIMVGDTMAGYARAPDFLTWYEAWLDRHLKVDPTGVDGGPVPSSLSARIARRFGWAS